MSGRCMTDQLSTTLERKAQNTPLDLYHDPVQCIKVRLASGRTKKYYLGDLTN